MEKPLKRPLGGEAKHGSIRILDGTGQVVDPNLAICPIFKQNSKGKWTLIGTGFFITVQGVFATARHVLMDIIDENGKQLYPVAIMQFISDKSIVIRLVSRFCINNDADVAIGVATSLKDNKTGEDIHSKICTLTYRTPNIGDRICTYAFPNTVHVDSTPQELHFFPDYYDGRIEEFYPNGRDRIFLPAPCYRTSIVIHHGASGGPVFDSHGKVFGINSTGFTGESDISFVSRIIDILPLKVIRAVVPGSDNTTFTIRELAELRHVKFEV